MMILIIRTLLLLAIVSVAFGLARPRSNFALETVKTILNFSACENSAQTSNLVERITEELNVSRHKSGRLLEELGVSSEAAVSGSKVIIDGGNTTILSENKTFQLGFFNISDESRWYLGIWYTSIPTPTYVWVANREAPVRNLSAATLEITTEGRLAVVVGEGGESRSVWETSNTEKAMEVRLSEEGNLLLFTGESVIAWQSFDFPADTWLPGMNLTSRQWLSCWKSTSDPAPGKFSLRLKPPEYGEFELLYNGTQSYWSTGKWNGAAFVDVPQMTIPYIYKFHFASAFTAAASFSYTVVPLENGTMPALTRFQVDINGQLRQFTWSPQTEDWNMFWQQPDNPCLVYGLCGNLGFCNFTKVLSPCKCFPGFRPVDGAAWDAGDLTTGCRRGSDDLCLPDDMFEEVGAVSYTGGAAVSSSASRTACETACLRNCSCIGFSHNVRTNLCKNIFGLLLNLRNLASDSTTEDVLHLRLQKGGSSQKHYKSALIVITVCACFLIILTIVLGTFFILRKKKIIRRKDEEETVFPVTNLMVFSYKELNAATQGFSDKLGHGGFGAVFRGELSDSTSVAVKRLERPGGGEKEFRAEVGTIGNIQHVNLVRLRGFCSENSHRLLVYDYMPNGPLSVYLKKDGQDLLSWDVRFRIAIGTARGIAYIHEECRNCIIHCDIKPENILLDEDYFPKVSDFGLAKLIGRDFSRVLATMRGTWGYVAPEWISGVAITAKADVYSYGMTLLELIGGRRNVEVRQDSGGRTGEEGGGGGGEKWFFPPWAAGKIIEGNLAVVVDERLRGMYDKAEAERVGLVAVWCIQDDEATRPTMGMVVKMLEGVVEVGVPPPPKLLQALISGESYQGVGADSGNTGGGGGTDDDTPLPSGGSKGSPASFY